MQLQDKTKRMAFAGLLTTFALLLSYIESLIPFVTGIPGMKLGLANVAIVLVIYLYDYRMAILINVVRIVLAGLLFGNFFSILYSLAGAALSLCAMMLFKKMRFSMMGVSMTGGVFHNVGQLLVAVLVVYNGNLFYYLPYLLLAGLVTGWLVGIVSGTVYPYIRELER